MAGAVKTKFVATGDDKTAATFSSVGKRLDRMQSQAKVAALALGGLFALRRLARFAGNLAKEMGSMSDAAQRVEATSEGYQRMNKAFETLLGKGSEITDKMLPTMNQQLASPAGQKQIEKLGLSMADLNQMTAPERFMAVGSALAGMGDELERNYMASQLLGRGAKDVMPLMADGAENFRRNLEDVGNMADVVTDRNAEMGDRVSDAMNLISGSIRSGFMNTLGNSINFLEEKFGDIDYVIAIAYERVKWFVAGAWGNIKMLGDNIGRVVFYMRDNWRTALVDMAKYAWDIVKSIGGFFAELGKQIWRAIRGRGFDLGALGNAWRDIGQTAAEGFKSGLDAVGWQTFEMPDFEDARQRVQAGIDAKRRVAAAQGKQIIGDIEDAGVKAKAKRDQDPKLALGGTFEAFRAITQGGGAGNGIAAVANETKRQTNVLMQMFRATQKEARDTIRELREQTRIWNRLEAV